MSTRLNISEGIQVVYHRNTSALIAKATSSKQRTHLDLDTLNNFTELKDIRPKSLTIVGIYGVYNTNYRSVINRDLTYIETRGTVLVSNECFHNSFELETVKHGEGLRALSDDVYNGCASLKSVELPTTVERLGERVFYGCRSLRQLTIPIACPIRIINSDAFAFIGTTGVFSIPDDVSVIENNALHHASIQFIKGMKSVVSIGEYFGSKTDLLKFDFKGYYLKTIGRVCFSFCPKLESIRINAPIESIGPDFCVGSDRLTSIVIESESSIRNIGVENSRCVSMQYNKGNVMIDTRVPYHTVADIQRLIGSRGIEIYIMCPDGDIDVASLLRLSQLKKLVITSQYTGRLTKKAHV